MALEISCLAIFSMLSARHQIWKYLQSHLSGLDSFFLFCRRSVFWILSRWGSVVHNNSENYVSSFKQGKTLEMSGLDQMWLNDGLLCVTKWHLWPSQPLTFDLGLTGLTLTPEQVQYTVALNPFVRACVGKSRAEKVVCPLHPGTHRERMDPLGGLLEGERTGHRREDHVEKGEGRRGGDSAKGYAASIPAEGPLLHSPWWIASRLYQPPILKLFMFTLAMFEITY